MQAATMNVMLEYSYHHVRNHKTEGIIAPSEMKTSTEVALQIHPKDQSAIFSLKRKTYALIWDHPRYMREQIQLRFIYKAFFRGRYTWVSQHVRLVEYAVSGFPRMHYGVIKEYNHPEFVKEPLAIVEFTNKSRYCLMLNEEGKAALRFSLNRTQLCILHLTCRNFSKIQIAELLNSTSGAVYSNVKMIEKIMKEKSWKAAVGRAVASGLLWEVDEPSINN